MAAKQHLRKSKTQQADNPHHFRQNVSAVALPCLIGIHYAGARATYHLDLDKSTPLTTRAN